MSNSRKLTGDSEMSAVEFLISTVRKRPILWNKRHKNYHNRLLACREWDKVAKIMRTTFFCTTEQIKKKWKNLRDTFAREYRKNCKSRTGADYTGTWPYFHLMLFLKNSLRRRQPDRNQIQSAANDSVDMLEPLDDNQESVYLNLSGDEYDDKSQSIVILSQGSPNSSMPRPTPSPQPSSTAVKLEPLPEIKQENNQYLHQEYQDNNDEDVCWLKSIVPYMKQLSPLNKLQFRTRIQEQLLKELSKLNEPDSK